MDIQGKVVLVTGASSGMGAAIAKAMASAGGRVLLLARRQEKLERVAQEIGDQGGLADVYPVDVSDASAVASVAEKIEAEVGTPDILINNAAAGEWRFVDETTPEEAVQLMAVPYFAAFNIVHAFLPLMLERNSGHIVNISSVGSRFVWPGATAYLAARWALRGFSEALRADLHSTGINVTLYESGTVDSPYWESNPGSRERIPGMGRFVPTLTPDQVASAVVKGVRRNKKLIVIPLAMKITYLQHRFFPGVVQWLMTTTGYRRRSS